MGKILRATFVFFALCYGQSAFAQAFVATGQYFWMHTGGVGNCVNISTTPGKCMGNSGSAACGAISPGMFASNEGANTVNCTNGTSGFFSVSKQNNVCWNQPVNKDMQQNVGGTYTCIPRCTLDRNPITHECEDCPSNAWDIATASCINQDCGPNEMQVGDEGYTLTQCVGTGCAAGSVGYCQPFGTCENSLGDLEYDATFEFCQEAKDACDSLGGTYGAIGTEGGNRQVCLVDYGDPTPTCASGSQMMFTCDDGTNSCEAKCVATTEPPNATCDGALYDCDGDGNVDDQDKDGCKDNGTANEVGCVGTPPGGPGTNPGEPGGGNIGQDPLAPPVKGAGDCDPTSQNYAECAGFGSSGVSDEDAQSAIDGYGDELAAALSGMGSAVDGLEGDMVESLGDGDAGISAPGWVSDLGDSIFPDYSCSTLSFSWKGQTIAITCDDTEPLRDILGFFAAALTIIAVIEIALRKPA